VKKALEHIREHGKLPHIWTGMRTTDNDLRFVYNYGIADVAGALIVGDVEPGSPADEAGLESGDLIVTAEGRQVRNSFALESIVVQHRVGDTIRLEYIPYRERRTRATQITLKEQPRRPE
jgi:S1-C subfamily serine protease